MIMIRHASWITVLSLSFAGTVFSGDLGFRYQAGKCLNAKGEAGLNPSFLGQCADLRGVVISRLNLDGIDFSGSKFTNTDLQLTTFRGGRLVDVDFESAKLAGADFIDAHLERVSFQRSSLKNAKFSGATVLESSFKGVDLGSFDLSLSNFARCNFDEANFNGTKLTEAVLESSSFKGANFKDAHLAKADLRRANFDGANLRGSNLEGAEVKGATFAGAKYNRRTKLPFTQEEAANQKMTFIRVTEFSGIMNNVPIEELDDWEICHVSKFAESQPLEKVLKDCQATHVMLACRVTGGNTFIVAGYGAYNQVFKEIGTSQTGTLDNDVLFYYSNTYSIGFAAKGDTLQRNSCDVGTNQPEKRLCFHTQNQNLSGGYRCGATVGLNSSTAYERVFLKANP
ncbi:MAG: pentapeptide repeat-containing protein [Bacteriovoracia bacterium]